MDDKLPKPDLDVSSPQDPVLPSDPVSPPISASIPPAQPIHPKTEPIASQTTPIQPLPDPATVHSQPNTPAPPVMPLEEPKESQVDSQTPTSSIPIPDNAPVPLASQAEVPTATATTSSYTQQPYQPLQPSQSNPNPQPPPSQAANISAELPAAITPLPPKSRFNKKIIIIIAIILLLLGTAYALFVRGKNIQTGKSPSLLQNINQTDLSKYDVDTDGDGYPDSVEKEVGLDPNVSEYTRCKTTGCGEADYQQTATSKRNVLIILDASGSMGIASGTQTRMEAAKKAILNYVTNASESTSIGLMVYGHKGSNSTTDKPASCASAQIIAPLGSITASSVSTYLGSVSPVGWTPTGLALREAKSGFTGKEGQNNEVILVSDGEETCNTDPVSAAQELKDSGFKAVLNVIGFAVDANTQAQLRSVSSAGGGIYSSANSYEDLERQLNDLYENGEKLLSESKCKSTELDAFRACYNEAHSKVFDWTHARLLTFYDKKISKKEYDRLDELYNFINDQRFEVTQSETDSLIQEQQQKAKDLWGE